MRFPGLFCMARWELVLTLLWAFLVMVTGTQGTVMDVDMDIQQAGSMEALVVKEFGGLVVGRGATNLQVSFAVFILMWRGRGKGRSRAICQVAEWGEGWREGELLCGPRRLRSGGEMAILEYIGMKLAAIEWRGGRMINKHGVDLRLTSGIRRSQVLLVE